MKTHINILGWIYIIFGLLSIFLGVIISLLIVGGGWISGDETAITITSIVAICTGGLFIAFSVPGVVAGMGVLKHKMWGRILSIVLGILNLPGFPVGTAIGVYTLYVMLDDETSEIFST